jgi:RNase P/RNase MRP subunit POP5
MPMKLLPALKQKKRYIVFEIDKKFSNEVLKQAIMDGLLQFLGEFGVAKAAPLFIKQKSNRFILKVAHTAVDEVKAALILIQTIKKTPVVIKSVITSGTIKKASTYAK